MISSQKKIAAEDEKDSGVSGAIGMMGVGGMMGNLQKPLDEENGPQTRLVDVVIVGGGLAGFTRSLYDQ